MTETARINEFGPLDLKEEIRTVADYPHDGIQFRDITSLIGRPRAFRQTIRELIQPHVMYPIDKVAALDARGFIFGAPAALDLGAGLVLLRKVGKLPGPTISETYDLEYGKDVTLEMHVSDISEGDRVLLIDDLLATGGTAEAAIKLIRRAGAEVVEAAFVVDLPELGGANRLEAMGVSVRSLVQFDGE